MDNGKDKLNKKDSVDESGKVAAFDHLLIKDKESGQVILNRRETKSGKISLTK